jgi:hypothetical protein
MIKNIEAKRKIDKHHALSALIKISRIIPAINGKTSLRKGTFFNSCPGFDIN